MKSIGFLNLIVNMKLTKRKGFNFFRSYFDVYNELESKDDKVAFMDALLERQFMGVKPTELKGMAKFAYISQTNSIDSQVKGYEDKTKTRLNPLDTKIITPTAPPTYGGKVTPTLQVEVEVQEKGKDTTTIYEKFVDDVKVGKFGSRVESLYMRLRLKENSLTPLLKDFNLNVIERQTKHKDANDFFINFVNWLNVQERNQLLNKYKK
tara:strand:+ start:115 stop:738 length:624 start_codon:yes stop_codon:yes gene_type:complete